MKLIHKFKSLNYDKRNNKQISFLILHYTALPSIEDSIKYLCDKRNKVSCHYIISQNGKIYNLVNEKYRAWHAGQSAWLLEKDLNSASIGIELDFSTNNNNNRFSTLLINSLISLLKYLKKKYKIDKRNILGHSDVAPYRKIDPGEKFPWKLMYKKKLAIWHNKKEKTLKISRNIKCSKKDKIQFYNNLKKIGYNSKSKIRMIRAFQRRFRQKLVTGKIDKECLFISISILKQNKY